MCRDKFLGLDMPPQSQKAPEGFLELWEDEVWEMPVDLENGEDKKETHFMENLQRGAGNPRSLRMNCSKPMQVPAWSCSLECKGRKEEEEE
eukprot:c11357_g1_i2 orf=151-423(+)